MWLPVRVFDVFGGGFDLIDLGSVGAFATTWVILKHIEMHRVITCLCLG